MLGHMIAYIRKDRKLTKASISKGTNINTGHLTHIEKGERNPSHKALKEICTALNIPYQELLCTYDKELSDEQLEYNYIDHLTYNKIPAISKIDEYITCPADFANASFAYKIPDNAMAPMFKEDNYAYIEINGIIDNKAIGLFKLNDEYLIRRLMYKKDKFVLRADNKDVKDITVNSKDKFQIIGRVYI